MFRPSRGLGAIMAVTALVAAGCGGSDSDESTGASTTAEPGISGDKIKVGVLHSLSGTMAISECP